MFIVPLTDYLAHLRLFGHELVAQVFLLIGSIVQLLGCQNHVLQLFFSRKRQFGFIRGIHNEYLITVCDEFPNGLIHLLECHLTVKLSGQLQLFFRRENRLTVDKVLNTGTDELRVFPIIALTEFPLVMVQLLALGTLQFHSCKTMLAGTFRNPHSSYQSTQNIILVTTDRQRERLLRPAQEEH